jgi:hypothetical protein
MHMGFALEHLLQYETTKGEFLNKFITSDETWIHHVTPESKVDSMTWKHFLPANKKIKTAPTVKKCVAAASGMHKASCWTFSQGVRQSMQPVTAAH